jgi:hypothetical protein
MTDELSPSKSSRELEKNYKILPLTMTDRITDEIGPSKSFRELKKLQDLPLLDVIICI